jgi:predicted RNase H-like HicB family nuclease
MLTELAVILIDINAFMVQLSYTKIDLDVVIERWFLEEGMDLTIESEQEADGRWIAEVLELPGVLSYGPTRDAAIAHVQALALRVLADRLAKHTGLTPEDL